MFFVAYVERVSLVTECWKSTLFNALLEHARRNPPTTPLHDRSKCGVVTVPDERLDTLREIANTNVVIPAAIEFVDIAGLVAGAAKGKGLGINS